MIKKSKLALAMISAGVLGSQAYADGVPGGSMQHNPSFNVVLEGRYVSQDEAAFGLEGFQPHGSFNELGVYENGFSTGHNEVNMGAEITEDTSGVLSFAIESHDGDTEVNLEEAYVETSALGSGLYAKVGQFFSGVGLLNTVHEHRQDFANAPLVYIGMFGGHLSDAGAQLSWRQNSDLKVNVGVEATRGSSYPGGANEDNNAGLALFAKVGGDIGSSSSWNLGVSHYSSDFDSRHTEAGGGHHGTPPPAGEFELENGTVAVTGLDFEFKFFPNGTGKNGELKVSLEYFMRDEDGEGAFTDANEVDTASADYEGEQSGYYLSAVYTFMPQWRLGVRMEHLESDNHFANFDGDTDGDGNAILDTVFEDASGLHGHGHDPERTSVMVDYSPNSNSTIRAQWMADEATEEKENRVYLQYIVAIGGHGH